MSNQDGAITGRLHAIRRQLVNAVIATGAAIIIVLLSSCTPSTSSSPAVSATTSIQASPSIVTEKVSTANTAPAISRIYDAATLEAELARYERTSNRILDEIVWPVLLNNEKSQLGGKPMIRFPLWAEGENRQHPLAFYHPTDTNEIVFPVYSLKFLEDLCIAYAWLQINGYSLETISEYTAILKYGDAPTGGFPPPLEALGIPADALKNSEVDDLALGHFVTARLFIMLHELGHAFHRHQAPTTDPIGDEQDADRFAIDVMQRTPLPPLGILVFFMADAHWTAASPNEYISHPPSGQRIQALAGAVEDPTLAYKFEELGKLVDDPDIRTGFVATGKAGNFASLQPRRPGESPLSSQDSIEQSCIDPYAGVFHGEMVQYSDPEPFPIETHLVLQGQHVVGQFSFGLGIGSIEGSMVGEQLFFDWTWSGNYGKGVFTFVDGSRFRGTWGYREHRSNAGTWNGQCGVLRS